MKYIKLFENYKITDNQNFKKWFGNSKIVDLDDNPMIVYHGTHKVFDEFVAREHKKDTEGFYFTANPKYAETFAGYDSDNKEFYKLTKKEMEDGNRFPNIVPVYLSVQNPLIISNFDNDLIEDIGYWKHIYDKVKSKGYDGVMTEDLEQIFVFSPNQIKSAYGNKGSFDPTVKSMVESYGENITNSYKNNSKKYDCSLEDINKGYCDEISYDVIKDVIGEENYINVNDIGDIKKLEENVVYEIDDGIFWSDNESKYGYNGDYWNIENVLFFGKPPFDFELLNNFMLNGHVWIYYNGKHYDAEVPDGVDTFWDLPIYKRQINKIMNKND